MDGLFIQTSEGRRRPKSKKEVRQALAENPSSVSVEVTSFFSPDHGRNLTLDQAPACVDFVGPNPHTDRRFYGTIRRTPKGWKLT